MHADPVLSGPREEATAEVSEQRPQYMKNFVRACKMINMWPSERKTFRYYFVAGGTTTFCLLFITTFYIRIQMEGKNMDGIAEAIDFATVFTSGTFRFFYVHARGEKYLLLVRLINSNFIYCTFYPERNQASIKEYNKVAYRIISFYGCFTLFWILQFCSVPGISYLWEISRSTTFVDANGTVIDREIAFPVAMKVYVPFDVVSNSTNAFLFYLYQIIGFCLFGLIYVVTDCFWYMVIFLTIGQLGLIKESLNTVNEILNDNNDEGNEVSLLDETRIKEVEEGLKKCIKHHQFTKEFIRMIDNIFNPIVLVDLLHATISLAFILLDTTIAVCYSFLYATQNILKIFFEELNKGDWFKIMYSIEYFTTSITHMFFFDWLGNELAFKEQELSEAVHRLSWYRCPKLRVSLLMVSALSRRPYQLTGGKMYRLSLHFFTTMIKAVFSYFTFLFQLLNGKPNNFETAN